MLNMIMIKHLSWVLEMKVDQKMDEKEEFKEAMRSKFSEMQELGIVDIDEKSRKLVITGDYLVFGKAEAEDESHTALCFRIISTETPFSMFHLVSDKEELRKLRNAIDDILLEEGGVETV